MVLEHRSFGSRKKRDNEAKKYATNSASALDNKIIKKSIFFSGFGHGNFTIVNMLLESDDGA